MFTDVSGQRIGPMFKDQESKKRREPASRNVASVWAGFFLLGLLTLEDGTDTLSRNIGKKLSHHAA
jgi:hypothetical protein